MQNCEDIGPIDIQKKYSFFPQQTIVSRDLKFK
jgi:hypothetical protein